MKKTPSEFYQTIYSRANGSQYPRVTGIKFDRDHFIEDLYYLIKFKNNPQEMIDSINLLSKTYIWTP